MGVVDYLRRFLADRAKRYRWEVRFWQLNAVVAAEIFTFQRALWDTFATLYLIEVSVYALVLTAGGAAEAAEAAQTATELKDSAGE